MPSIFLSHNHKDKAFVRRLGKDLAAEGVRVWIDEAEILVGDSLISKVEGAIDEMDYLGVILSPSSVGSTWVTREVMMALDEEISQRKVKVLPILLSDCDLPGFLRDKLYADFRDRSEYGESLQLLLRRLVDASNTATTDVSPPTVHLIDSDLSMHWLRRFSLGAIQGGAIYLVSWALVTIVVILLSGDLGMIGFNGPWGYLLVFTGPAVVFGVVGGAVVRLLAKNRKKYFAILFRGVRGGCLVALLCTLYQHVLPGPTFNTWFMITAYLSLLGALVNGLFLHLDNLWWGLFHYAKWGFTSLFKWNEGMLDRIKNKEE